MSNWKPCHVYLIGFDRGGKFEGPVKVGITTNVESRLKALQTGCHERLKIGAYLSTPMREMALAMESCFHTVFAEHRLEGEWFDMPPTKALKGLCDEFASGFDHFLDDDETYASACERSGLNTALALYHTITANDVRLN